MRWSTRTMIVVALGAAGLLVAPTGVGADCGGPTIAIDPTSGPAGTGLVVDGTGWGDNCYDTGPPPAGQGVLGNPLTDIRVVFVDAAGVTTELGVVDADDDYRFRLEAAVPSGAVPGPAQVRVDRAIPQDFEVLGAVIPASPAFTG